MLNQNIRDLKKTNVQASLLKFVLPQITQKQNPPKKGISINSRKNQKPLVIRKIDPIAGLVQKTLILQIANHTETIINPISNADLKKILILRIANHTERIVNPISNADLKKTLNQRIANHTETIANPISNADLKKISNQQIANHTETIANPILRKAMPRQIHLKKEMRTLLRKKAA